MKFGVTTCHDRARAVCTAQIENARAVRPYHADWELPEVRKGWKDMEREVVWSATWALTTWCPRWIPWCKFSFMEFHGYMSNDVEYVVCVHMRERKELECLTLFTTHPRSIWEPPYCDDM